MLADISWAKGQRLSMELVCVCAQSQTHQAAFKELSAVVIDRRDEKVTINI